MNRNAFDPLPNVHDKIAQLERSLEDVKTALTLVPSEPLDMVRRPLDEPLVRSIIAARRARERQLGQALFADPVWDLLLEALAAELGQAELTAAMLEAAASVPASTAGRWIVKLEADGWLRPVGPPASTNRRMALTATGSAKLRHFFETVGAALPVI